MEKATRKSRVGIKQLNLVPLAKEPLVLLQQLLPSVRSINLSWWQSVKQRPSQLTLAVSYLIS